MIQQDPRIELNQGSLIIQHSDYQSGQSTLECHDHTLYMLYFWELGRTQNDPVGSELRTQVRILNQILSRCIGPTFYNRVVIFHR